MDKQLVQFTFLTESNLSLPRLQFFKVHNKDEDFYLIFEPIEVTHIITPEIESVTQVVNEDPSRTVVSMNTSDDKKSYLPCIFSFPNLLNHLPTTVIKRKCTKIEIYQETDLPPHLDVEKAIEIVKGICDNFIDQFIKVTDFADISALGRSNLPFVGLRYSQDYKIHSNSLEVNFSDYKYDYKFLSERNLLRGHIDRILPKQKIEELADQTKELKSLTLSEKLIYQAREHSLWSDDHNTAVIMLQTALEVFLQTTITDFCDKNGLVKLPKSSSQQKTILDKNEAIINGNVKSTLLFHIDYLRDVQRQSSTSIFSSVEYKAWNADAYELRNAIVHNGYRQTTATDFEKAFKAIVNFLNYIAQVFADRTI